MERTIEVDTGESVVFRYELAGLGSRFLALAVDTAIQTSLVVALIVIALVLISQPFYKALYRNLHVAQLSNSVLVAAAVFVYFLIFFGYFIAFEWLWQGRTPGKRAIGIRAVRDGGFPLDFSSSSIRNLVRILEAALGFYAISAVSMLCSAQNKRLGDFAAGTIVVRDRRFESYATLRRDERTENNAAVRDLSAQERELIRRYVARRETLAAPARHDLAMALGKRIRPRLGATFEHLDDDTLLVHLAQTAL